VARAQGAGGSGAGPECRGAEAEAPARCARAGREADREQASVAGDGRMGRSRGTWRRRHAVQQELLPPPLPSTVVEARSLIRRCKSRRRR
jgi:hypothetical protein